jgi:catechol 2,3-dioxygenase-like lactoylglutathione lyase family enzyme
MSVSSRPGRKPRRIYLRLARLMGGREDELPAPHTVREFLHDLDRVGRLVAHGRLTDPPGDLLIYRAREGDEAKRVLRADPWASVEGARFEVVEWNPSTLGSGVNLEPPPARGSGRLTMLQRVAVVVTDQERAIRFYHDVLGLEIRARDMESGYVELALGKGAAGLSLIAPRPDWGEPYYSEAKDRIGTRTGIVFQTDSVAALELRLRHLGADVTEKSHDEPWGGPVLRFADPDGNEFLAFEEAPLSSRRRRSPRPMADDRTE